jgi:1-acyl-sn-glycerol-3-phosphate acyltransferase
MPRFLARLFLFLMGWKPEGEPPADPKYVLIAAPHTTNWDFPLTIALAAVFGVKIRWMGKHTLFRFPFGGIMRRLGGIPIRRHERGDIVQQMAADFANYQELALTVPAEGTRSRVEYWKSGFYHIANQAQVPIVLGYLDYERKRGGFGKAVMPTGNIQADMDVIRAFYADKIGKFPEKFGPVRLKEEGEAPGKAPDALAPETGTRSC